MREKIITSAIFYMTLGFKMIFVKTKYNDKSTKKKQKQEWKYSHPSTLFPNHGFLGERVLRKIETKNCLTLPYDNSGSSLNYLLWIKLDPREFVRVILHTIFLVF